MAPKKPRRHAGEHDLIEAFDLPGCPVCRLAHESVDAFFTSVAYEQVNDLDLRERIRNDGGFCPVHARRFLELPLGPLATAIIYRDVLVTTKRRIEAAAPRRRASLLASLTRGRLGSPPGEQSGRAGCVACDVLSEAEGRHLDVLCERLARPAVRERYTRSGGLCLPHLERALQRAADAESPLRETAVSALGAIVTELEEYIQKHDYRFHTPDWDDAKDVPERALDRAVGRNAEPRG
ncbi:MAG: DUF6062 family protein [Chloroflexota bacterium]